MLRRPRGLPRVRQPLYRTGRAQGAARASHRIQRRAHRAHPRGSDGAVVKRPVVTSPAVTAANIFGADKDAGISEPSIEVAVEWRGFDEYEECVVPPARPTTPVPAWAEEAPTTPGFDIREFNAAMIRRTSGSEGEW